MIDQLSILKESIRSNFDQIISPASSTCGESVALLSVSEFTILQANASFARLLGCAIADIGGKSLLDFCSFSLEDVSRDLLVTNACAVSDSVHVNTVVRRSDGTVIDVELCLTHLRLAEGRYINAVLRDASRRKADQRAIAASEAKFRALFNSTRRLVAILTPDGRNVETNPIGYAFTGLDAEQTRALYFWEGHWWANDEERTRIKAAVEAAATGAYVQFEVSQRGSDGKLYVSDFSLTPIFDEDGTVAFLMPEANDITALKTTQEELVRREREIRSLVEHTADGIVRYDCNFRRVFINQPMGFFKGASADRFFGTTLDEVSTLRELPAYKRHLRSVFDTAKSISFEIRFTLPSGSDGLAEVKMSPEFDSAGAVEHVLAVTHDITERAQSSDRIRHMAYTDPLTGLPNRTSFSERFAALTCPHQQVSPKFALLMIDLDHFKVVNDTLGHAAGDELLVGIASRLQAGLMESDMLARLGGDEFAILIDKIDDRSKAEEVAERLLLGLRAPLIVLGRELLVSASIGIAIFPDNGDSTETLLSNADEAMYQAKRDGKGRFRTSSRDVFQASACRLALSTGLQTAS
ncbi:MULTISPECIES: sensor domain-containing diguanylate cyclase [unclassified Rhizobium]|uniref:sensor domain-containing diguanylate cyclase n=1 Tax=unclassified Rhizobium TaxID=2613769 RepID=UPI001ADB5528|nr:MULTISPECIES: sensor domain-containing diguanylate cyclase [unclassified Rhizobium]MBO9102137.1 sensor domain-containing diguanylate cyclase [Rhizobium sp. L58/93]MBO9172339.1 sensor domain-containing diguanylate cyclase [Rhizobium sp. L245/93]MBO9186499.1 sensor domain-containing diguanylate cyclase [Rhizobium sp. E27B/91]QXZ86108.1 sensor domain-containing diguanylate cyclase [Rhizobium sp. K1/93]QXZ92436.1 sensor domain-containing diguanylate cyclase [Rhizobium sp. K15/93]